MKRFQLYWAFCMAVLLLFAGTVWAADQPAPSNDTPAILASLDAGNATILDDQTAMAVRGQAYEYVLVKILGINALDGGYGVRWTWNPLGYRYGAWGGPGWSTGDTPADVMDELFMWHDLAYGDAHDNGDKLDADKALLCGLLSLPKTSYSIWGPVYLASPTGLTAQFVQVSGISFIGNKFFFGWRSMPYTEYARREALAAMGIMVFGRSLVPSIKLQ